MNVRKMTDLDLAGQRVLIREDLNVPIKNGRVTSDARLRACLPTILAARDSGAKVLLMSHLGRPTEGEPSDEFSLAPVAEHLAELAPAPVLPSVPMVEMPTVVDRTVPVSDTDVVEAAFADIEPTSADIFLTLKKDRPMTSVEWERKVAPKFQTIADARVNFQSQSGGGFGRDVIMMFGSDDPALLERTANKLVGEMKGLKELRDPRVQGDMQRPEIIIKPRMDLAASMGVTTAALSQSIRIATIGDIDQNVAKFSLSDRQIPIRVSLSEDSRRDLSTIQNMPVPTVSGGTVPLRVATADSDYTSGYEAGAMIDIPIAHHDGNYFADGDTIAKLHGEDRVAFTYGDNPNGSQSDIAGILSSNRRVLGMMPHPERAADAGHGGTDGAALFRALAGSLVTA